MLAGASGVGAGMIVFPVKEKVEFGLNFLLAEQ
jgi:hypothetical protein